MAEMQQRLTVTSILYASIAGLAIGGPLLGMMGFSFLASTTVLLVSSPLLLVFSPLLLGAGFFLALTMAGFAIAGTMALAGISAFAWILRCFRQRRAVPIGSEIEETLKEGGPKVKEQTNDWAGYLQQTVQGNGAPENKENNRG